jgi:hypothetical protein
MIQPFLTKKFGAPDGHSIWFIDGMRHELEKRTEALNRLKRWKAG